MIISFPTRIRIIVCVLSGLFYVSVNLRAQVADFETSDLFKSDSVAALYPKHSLTNLKSLADKLTKPFNTDVDKFRAIYKWVCTNIENDYGFYIKNKSRREKLKDRPEELQRWNQKVTPRFFQKLLHEHKTVCTGYAYLVKELAFHAGLTCKIIDGYGRTTGANIGGFGIANHSWNAIRLTNQWYLCDATWSSGTIDPEQKKFIKQFSDAYFLTPPSLFVLNHYPLDSAWVLLKDKPTLQEFLNGPLIYKSLLNYKVLPIFPKTFNVEVLKGKTLSFCFTQQSDLAIEKVELRIVQGTTPLSAYPKMYTNSSGLNTIDYVFSRKGTFVVHILFNDEYVFTYTVRVS